MIAPADLLTPEVTIPLTAFAIGFVLTLFLRPRRFYFIRHGETVLNAAHVRQGEEGELSESGRAQADRVGKALKPLHIHGIIASSYPRAQETAEIMNKHLRVHVL